MPQTAPSPTGSRIATRHKVFLPAEILGPTGSTRAHLLNVSATGALLHADVPPVTGTTVHLHCGATTWFAKVVWAAEKRFGVVHVTRLGTDSVAALVGSKPLRSAD